MLIILNSRSQPISTVNQLFITHWYSYITRLVNICKKNISHYTNHRYNIMPNLLSADGTVPAGSATPGLRYYIDAVETMLGHGLEVILVLDFNQCLVVEAPEAHAEVVGVVC